MTLAFIIIFFINLVLAMIPLVINRKKMVNIVFSVMALALSVWIIANYFVWNLGQPLFWARMTLLGSGVFAAFFLLFFLIYPRHVIKINWATILLVMIIPCGFIGISPTHLVIQDVVEGTQIYGVGYSYFSIYFFLYVLLGLLIASYKSIKYRGSDRKTLKEIFSWGLVTLLLTTVTNIVLPINGIYEFMILGPIISSLFILVTFYSVLKNQMFENIVQVDKFKAIISVSLLLVLLYSILTSVYRDFFPNFYNVQVFNYASIFFWLLAATQFHEARVFLQSTANKLFLKDTYKAGEVSLKATKEIFNVSEPKEIVGLIYKTLDNDMGISEAYIFLPDNYEVRKTTAPVFELWEWDSRKDEIIQTSNLKQKISSPMLQLAIKQQKILRKEETTKKVMLDMEAYNAELLVPCFLGDQLMAFILLAKKDIEDAYTEDDMNVLRIVREQLPRSLDLSKKTEESATIDIVNSMQAGFLTLKAELDGYDISHFYHASEKVSGDFYDMISFPEQKKQFFFLGDATGHGLPAGIIAFMVQTAMAAIVETNGDLEPREINYLANTALCRNLEHVENPLNMSILTALLHKNKLTLSGKHDELLLYRKASGEVETINVDQISFDIGFMHFPKDSFGQIDLELSKGDILFLYSDGITEARKNGNKDDDEFGMDRLKVFIKQHADRQMDELRDALVARLAEFTNETYLDDFCLMAVKRG